MKGAYYAKSISFSVSIEYVPSLLLNFLENIRKITYGSRNPPSVMPQEGLLPHLRLQWQQPRPGALAL